jgi:hypothetical protein
MSLHLFQEKGNPLMKLSENSALIPAGVNNDGVENIPLSQRPALLSNHFALLEQNGPIYVSFNENFVMGMGIQRGVVIIIKTNQGQRVCPGGMLPRGIKGAWREG